jgi:tetratricopeptide (TPR) repeat protein
MKKNGKKMLALMSILLFSAASLFASSNDKGIEYYRAELYGAAKIFLLSQKNLSNTEQAECYYYLGQTYYQLNQLDSASYYYQKSVESDPEYPFGYVGEGKMELKNGNTKAADDLFKKAGNFAKKDPSVFTTIAEIWFDAGLTDNIKSALDKAKKIQKNYSGVYAVEGDMLMKQGKVGEASSRYEMAIYFNKADKLAYLKLAQVYKDINPDSALKFLDDLIAIDPEYIPAYAVIGDINRSAGEYGRALSAYEKFISIPGVPVLQHERYAQLLYFTDQYDKSLEQIQYVLSQDPDNQVMHRIEAYNNFKKENFELGAEQLKAFLQNTTEDRHIYLDYLYYGQMLMKTKRYAEALESFQKAIPLADEPKKVQEIYKEAIAAAYSSASYSEAVDLYEKYFEIVGDNASSSDYFIFGYRVCYPAIAAIFQSSDSLKTPVQIAEEKVAFNTYLEKGDKAFSKVIEMQPDNYLGYVWKSNLYAIVDAVDVKEGRKLQGVAVPYTNAAIEFLLSHNEDGARNKDLLSLYRYMLTYYVSMDDTNSIIDYAKKMVAIDPNDATAKNALDILKVKY